MERSKLAFLAVGFCLAGLLSGCGSSNQAQPPPPPPLEIVSPTTSLPNGGPSVFYSVTLDATGGISLFLDDYPGHLTEWPYIERNQRNDLRDAH